MKKYIFLIVFLIPLLLQAQMKFSDFLKVYSMTTPKYIILLDSSNATLSLRNQRIRYDKFLLSLATAKWTFQDSVSVRKNAYYYGSNNFYLDNIYNSASKILFDGAFRLTGRDTALQDYVYSKTVSGVRHLYWRRDNATPIKLDSIGTSGAFDSTKAWTMLGNWQFNKTLQFGAYGVFRLPARDTTTVSAALYRTGASDEYIAFNYNAIGGIDTLMSWAKARATYEPKFTTLGITKGGTNANWFTTGKFVKYNGTKLISTTYDSTSFEPTITAGTTAQYWRGDKSWQTLNATAVGLGNVTNNAQIYSLNSLTAQTQTFAIGTSGTAPNWSSATSTHTLNIPMASTATVTAGLISKTEYDNFNSKEAALTFSYPLVRSVNTISLGYNTTNLQLTANQLNTIQDIATSSSPTFGGLTAINGNSNTQSIYPLLTDTYDLGSFTKYWSNAYMSQIQATIFAENTISAVGGYMFITKGQGILPAITSGTTQINFGQTMTVGDFVLIKAKDNAGNYKTEYMTIGTLVSGTTYNVTRDVANANLPDPAWTDGTVYVVLGNNGNGRLELNAYDTPRLSIIKQGTAYNSQTELIRLGDLNGFLGYATETYGIAIGEATKYLKYDPTNGLVIAGNVTATTGAIGGWTLGATTLTGTNSLLSSTGYISFGATPPTSYGNNVGAWLGYSSGAKLSLYSDANNYMQWNGSALSVGGATITGGTIQTSTSGTARVELNGANNELRFYNSTGAYATLKGFVSGSFNLLYTPDHIQATNYYGTYLSLQNSNPLDLSSRIDIVSTSITPGATTYGLNINTGSTSTTNNVYGIKAVSTIYYGATGTTYGIYASAAGGATANWAGYFNSGDVGIGAGKFIVNTSGQLTKVNNISPTAGLYLRGDGTSFSPLALQSGDITTSLGYTPVTNARTLTINGTALDLSANRSWSVGTVTSVSGVAANGFTWSIANATTTPAITLTLQNATTSQSGQLTSTDWNTFNGKTTLASVVAATNTWAAPQTFSSSTKRTALVLTSITSNTIDTYSTVEYSYIQLNVAGGGTLTYINYNSGNPTDGTELIITNVNATAVTLSEDTTNNGMRLGGASVTLNQWESVHLIYAINGASKRWSKMK